MEAEKAEKFAEQTLVCRADQLAELAGAYVLRARDLGCYVNGVGVPGEGDE